MRPPPRRILSTLLFGVLVGALPARASESIDHYRAGHQASLEKDWETAVRQFTLALSDSLDARRRVSALESRAAALVQLHECERAAADVTALRTLGTLAASRAEKVERMVAGCDRAPLRAHVPVRPLPLSVRVYGGAHRYCSADTWLRAYGAEVAWAPGMLHGFVRGGWIGRNDSAGEVGVRVHAPSFRRLRPWIEGSAGLQRIRPGSGFTVSVTIVEWDSLTTTFGPPPGPTFHGTSAGLGLGVDLPIHSFFGLGLAGRWRNVHWKSDTPAVLPGDDREFVAYLFAR